MAATVGATLSGVTFALRHAGEGPYQSSGGNYYFFGRDSVNTGTVEPHKASDPTSAFTAQTAKTMSSATTTAIEAMACYPVGQVIHVVTQLATGQVFYNFYTMDTDTWGLTTSETAVAAATTAPVTGATFISLVVRSGGEVVIAYCAGQTAMSSTFNMIRGTRRTGTNTYSALSANIDNGGSFSWTGCVAVLGASDRVHFFFRDDTAQGFQRTLSAANALQTFPASFGNAANQHSFGQGISYLSGATTKVRVPRRQGLANLGYVISLDSADSPTVTDTAASDNQPAGFLSGFTHTLISLAVDSTTEHLLYAASSDSDLYHDSNSGSGWGTDINELAGTINRITANVYTRSGTKRLASVIDNAGSIVYIEIDLAAADPDVQVLSVPQLVSLY